MRSYNKVILMGHLGADPEVRQTKSGVAVANFPLAINRMTKNSDGEKAEKVDYHRVTAWNGLADISKKHLAKGSAVTIEGRLINSSYDDKDGKRQFKTEVVADELNIITWKGDKEEVAA